MSFALVRREEMAQGTMVLNEIYAPKIAAKAQPGEFVIVMIDEKGERIPLTMADTDKEKGTITLIYATVGASTRAFGKLQVGDSFRTVVGPLGKPAHLEKVGTVVCVGGGTGTAVLYPMVKKLKQLGNKVITIVGSRNKDLLIMTKELGAVSDEILICTDDGSFGRKGFTTQLLKEVIDREPIQLAVAIGPIPMMAAVCKVTEGIPTMVSLNPIMIDGTGMCGACRVEVGGVTRYACVEGPEFDGHQVNFDQLKNRLNMYKEEEAHACKIGRTQNGKV